MICTFSDEIKANGEHLDYINYFNDLILFHQEHLVFLMTYILYSKSFYLSNFLALFLHEYCLVRTVVLKND